MKHRYGKPGVELTAQKPSSLCIQQIFFMENQVWYFFWILLCHPSNSEAGLIVWKWTLDRRIKKKIATATHKIFFKTNTNQGPHTKKIDFLGPRSEGRSNENTLHPLVHLYVCLFDHLSVCLFIRTFSLESPVEIFLTKLGCLLTYKVMKLDFLLFLKERLTILKEKWNTE